MYVCMSKSISIFIFSSNWGILDAIFNIQASFERFLSLHSLLLIDASYKILEVLVILSINQTNKTVILFVSLGLLFMKSKSGQGWGKSSMYLGIIQLCLEYNWIKEPGKSQIFAWPIIYIRKKQKETIQN